MNWYQEIIILFFLISSFIGCIIAYHQCKHKKNAYGTSPFYGVLYTGFVWGDVLYLGLFWTILSIICFILRDFLFFLVSYSLFWLVRSTGESLYWFLQQFSTLKKNPVERFRVHTIVKNDAVWFLNQVYWQCLSVITLITSIYLVTLWVRHILSHPYFLPFL